MDNKRVLFIIFLIFTLIFAKGMFSKVYAVSASAPVIVAQCAVVGTTNIRVVVGSGQVVVARDAATDAALGISHSVTGSHTVVPLISALTSGQRIYIESQTSGLTSQIMTVGSIIGPYITGGLRDGDTIIRGLGGSAAAGSTVRIVHVQNDLAVIGSGTINSKGTFEITLTAGINDNDGLLPLLNGIAGLDVVVGSTHYKGPTIEWPVNTSSTVIKGIGNVGSEVRVYDTNDLNTVVASADVGSDGTYRATISNAYTTQGNTLAAIEDFDDVSSCVLGGIITVGSSGGPGISNTVSNPVSHGDSQISGTGMSGESVYLEKLAARTDIGNGTVGSDSTYSISLSDALNSNDRIVAIENNISSPVVTVSQGGTTTLLGDYGNYPNPFDPNSESTTIEYILTNSADIKIHIYNLNAIEVKVIECPATTEGGRAGKNQVAWSGVDGYGKGLSTGVYLYRIFDSGSTTVLGRGKIAIIRK